MARVELRGYADPEITPRDRSDPACHRGQTFGEIEISADFLFRCAQWYVSHFLDSCDRLGDCAGIGTATCGFNRWAI